MLTSRQGGRKKKGKTNDSLLTKQAKKKKTLPLVGGVGGGGAGVFGGRSRIGAAKSLNTRGPRKGGKGGSREGSTPI